VSRGEAAASHQNSGHEGERGGVRATGGSGQRARPDPERVVPGNAAGERERPGGEIRRFRQSRPGAHGLYNNSVKWNKGDTFKMITPDLQKAIQKANGADDTKPAFTKGWRLQP